MTTCSDGGYNAFVSTKYHGKLDRLKEIELFKRYKEHDDYEARRILIESHIGLVINIAKKFPYTNQDDLSDHIQNGNVGLIIAIDKFDHKKGTRFSTYATWWIYQNISREMVNTYNLIRVPEHIRSTISDIINGEIDCFIKINNREPTVPELSDITGIDQQKILFIINIMRYNIVPIETDLFTGVNKKINKVKLVYFLDIYDKLSFLLDKLSINEKFVITHRYGIFGEKSKTLPEISEMSGIKAAQVRKIEIRAMQKMARLSDFMI